MKEKRYINPLTDFGFKKIFSDEEIMRDFLNDIIEPHSPIQSVIFLDKEMPPETKFERGIIYDMRCRLEDGEEVIVEMQNRGQDFFRDRICYYMARAISTQGERGDNDWKFNLHPVYGVFFMNFHLRDIAYSVSQEENVDKSPKETKDVCHVMLQDVNTGKTFSDKLQMWLIELPRYRRMSEKDCKTNIDFWLYTLTHMETMTNEIPFQREKPIFHKLENIADMAVLTHEEREYYNISLDSYRTNMAVMAHERNQGRREGLAKGLAEGLAEGRAKGLAEGRAEGRAEGLAEGRADVIKKMSQKLDSKQIADLLGLDSSYINNILNEGEAREGEA